MKSIYTIALAAVCTSAFAGILPISVEVNGSRVMFDGAQPQMMSNHVMVPLRGVFEQMGATVSWDNTDQEVTALTDSKKVSLRVNNSEAKINGQTVTMDAYPTLMGNHVMVPLRFVSEALGADVHWNDSTQTVTIKTARPDPASTAPPIQPQRMVIPEGTVIPVRLDEKISSESARAGDPFTARIDWDKTSDFDGLPRDTVIEGHVSVAKPMTDSAPGVLGLKFDRFRMPNGNTRDISAKLVGLDDKSVKTVHGKIVARQEVKKNSDLQFVGIGAGAGLALAAVTKGNVVNDTAIGAALGFIFGQTQKNKQEYKEVVIRRDDDLGLRLTQDFSFRVDR